MGLNFTQEQYKLIYTSIRRYQIDKCVHNSKEYQQCDEILNELFSLVYTQKQEQCT